MFSPCEPLYAQALDGTTTDERGDISAGVDLWRALGLSTLGGAPSQGADGIPIAFREAPELFRGVYEPEVGQITINRRLESNATVITVAHELGHALGLPHVPPSERISVMNPGNTSHPPDAEDREALTARWRECLPALLQR